VSELVQLYEAGATLAALSRQFDIHEQTVREHLRRRDVTIRPQQVLTAERADQVVTGYLAGKSLRTLAREFDLSVSGVRNYVLRAGVTLRPAVRPKGQAASE
jgi:DNA-binding CsgD family transcriptional regulator